MQKILFILIFTLCLKPLSAQVDNGFINCTDDIKTSINKMDSLNLDEEKFLNEYVKLQKIYIDCIYDKKIPYFKGLTLFDDTLDLAKIEEKVIFLNFWTLNCSPCIAELGILNELYDEYKKKDVIFISICLDTKSKILRKYKPRIITIPDGESIFNLYGIYSYPQNFIISKKHKIKKLLSGASSINNLALKEEIEFYLNKTLKEIN